MVLGMGTEIMKRRTIQQARAREKRILEGIAEIGPFLQDEDWRILGYEQLEDWVRDKLTPVLRELDASLGAEIRNPIILQIDADQQSKPPAQRLSKREMGELVGADRRTVTKVLQDQDKVHDVHHVDLDTTSDLEKETIIDAEIIEDPDLGKNLYQKVQEYKRQNPMPAAQDTAEDAAKWIPALIEGINADLDMIADWQEIGGDLTKEQLQEELNILKNKIARIEEKL